MLTLHLIRSGDTEYDGQGRIQGTLAIPLSSDGRLQVEQAAEQLLAQQQQPAAEPISAIYAGPCESVRQTAEIVGKQLGLKPKKLEKLANLDQGLWQGMLVEEVKSHQPKLYKKWHDSPDSVCPPEGESIASARERLTQVLTKLTKKHKQGAVALVLPSTLIPLLHCLILAEKPSDLWHRDDRQTPLWETLNYAPPVGSA